MAVRTYGVVLADILPLLPVNTKNISATTDLSTTGITGYIEDASGRVTAALLKIGADPDGLDADSTAQVQHAIKQRTVAFCMARLGRSSTSTYTSALREYEDTLARFEASGGSLASQPSTVTTTIDTNPSSGSRGEFTKRNMPW
jgi:hypothetical protein